MADKTTVDNPEVGTLDTFLSQNTAENTVENTGQNEINSTKQAQKRMKILCLFQQTTHPLVPKDQ
jgi:hypothetical protein